jgi:hypothetical protein
LPSRVVGCSGRPSGPSLRPRMSPGSGLGLSGCCWAALEPMACSSWRLSRVRPMSYAHSAGREQRIGSRRNRRAGRPEARRWSAVAPFASAANRFVCRWSLDDRRPGCEGGRWGPGIRDIQRLTYFVVGLASDQPLPSRMRPPPPLRVQTQPGASRGGRLTPPRHADGDHIVRLQY